MDENRNVTIHAFDRDKLFSQRDVGFWQAVVARRGIAGLLTRNAV